MAVPEHCPRHGGDGAGQGRHVGRGPLRLAGDGEGARDLWQRIRGEYETSVEQILAVTGRARLLDNMPVLQRSIELRNPYVDSLSELQVLLLGRLRALPADDPQRDGAASPRPPDRQWRRRRSAEHGLSPTSRIVMLRERTA